MKKANRAPSGLSAESKRFWTSVVSEYDIGDSAGRRLLLCACESLDLLRRAEAVVAADGMTTRDRYGALRAHPMLGVARDARGAMLTALKHLNLDIEPLRAGPGRPGGR